MPRRAILTPEQVKEHKKQYNNREEQKQKRRENALAYYYKKKQEKIDAENAKNELKPKQTIDSLILQEKK